MFNASYTSFLEGILLFLKSFNSGCKYFLLYSHAIVFLTHNMFLFYFFNLFNIHLLSSTFLISSFSEITRVCFTSSCISLLIKPFILFTDISFLLSFLHHFNVKDIESSENISTYDLEAGAINLHIGLSAFLNFRKLIFFHLYQVSRVYQ